VGLDRRCFCIGQSKVVSRARNGFTHFFRIRGRGSSGPRRINRFGRCNLHLQLKVR
jgi:hypothetical protein